MTRSPSSLAELIAPATLEDFLENVWEKTHLHARPGADALSSFFSLGEVEAWIKGGQGLVYVTPRTGDLPETKPYRPADHSLSTFYALFREGSLLVLEPFKSWPPLQRLIAGLGRELYAQVDASAFVAPPGTRAFPPHASGFDTLVLQLEGAAHWHLHEFWLLQRNPAEKKNLKFPLDWYGRPKTPVTAKLRLEPGDVLYIPRGMPYQAQPREHFSLHLQIDVQPLGWMDLLKIAIDCASIHSQDLRRSVPPGFLADPAVMERMRATYEELIRALPELTSFDEVIAATQRNRVKQQDFPPAGHFSQVLRADDLDVDSVVEHRPDILCFAERITDIDKQPRSGLFFGKEMVAGPHHLLRASLFIKDHPRFRVGELPGLDPASQVVLARRLIVEGLLRRVPAPGD